MCFSPSQMLLLQFNDGILSWPHPTAEHHATQICCDSVASHKRETNMAMGPPNLLPVK